MQVLELLDDGQDHVSLPLRETDALVEYGAGRVVFQSAYGFLVKEHGLLPRVHEIRGLNTEKSARPPWITDGFEIQCFEAFASLSLARPPS